RILNQAMQTTSQPDDRHWISERMLNDAWDEIGLKCFNDGVGMGLGECEIKRLKRDFLITISILVSIRWSGWSAFRVNFLLNADKNSLRDTNLPVSDICSQQLRNYMTEQEATDFLEKQHVYLPEILQGKGAPMVSPERRLPYIKSKHLHIGDGASGRVFKEVIPSGCYSRDGYTNQACLVLCSIFRNILLTIQQTDINVARKEIFVGDGMGKREATNIELLRNSITKHDHILPIYAVYTYKDTLNIISELADDDLEVFLTGDQYDIIFSASQCLAKLLSETCNLAHALAFLHDRLRETDKNQILCHMDFHTRNILVKDTANDFKFVISDFGLAKVQRDPRDRQTPLNLQEVTKTNARRRAGTFLAPEVRTGSTSFVGRKSDVWSLACIVIRILIRGVLGREALNQFDQSRVNASKSKSKDYFYSRTQEGGCVINEAVEIWLSNLSSKSGQFVRRLLSNLR
ncbi:kinase-like protein, partial [Glonium stellatum]